MSNIEHDIVRSPMLEKCFQLVLDVFWLLSRQPRNRVVAVKSSCRHAVTVLAVGYLRLQFGIRHPCVSGIPGPRAVYKNACDDCSAQYDSCAGQRASATS